MDSHRNPTLDAPSTGARSSGSGSTGGIAADVGSDTRFKRIELPRPHGFDSSNLSRMLAFSSETVSSSLTSTAGTASGEQPVMPNRAWRKENSDRRQPFASASGTSLGELAPELQPRYALGGAPPVLRPHPQHRHEDLQAQPAPPTFTAPNHHSPAQPSRSRRGMLGKRKASSAARGPLKPDPSAPFSKAEKLQEPSPQHASGKRTILLNQISFANPTPYTSCSSPSAPNDSYSTTSGHSLTPRSLSAQESQYPTPTDAPSTAQPHSHPSPYANSDPLNPNFTSDDAQYNAQQLAAAATQKISAESSSHGKQTSQPKLQVNMHLCNCCPRKPKKFDTFEELR